MCRGFESPPRYHNKKPHSFEWGFLLWYSRGEELEASGKRVRQGGAGETEVSPHLRRRSGVVKRSQSPRAIDIFPHSFEWGFLLWYSRGEELEASGKRVRQGEAGETEVSPHLRRRSGVVKRSQSPRAIDIFPHSFEWGFLLWYSRGEELKKNKPHFSK